MNLLLKTSIALTLAISLGLSEDKTLTLEDRWNLISVPTDTTVSSDYFNSDKVLTYNKTWNYNPTTITKGEGIWIKSTTKQNISFSGDSYKQNFSDLVEGWSLLGTGEDIILSDIFDSVWTFDGTWNHNPEIIKSGKGFWVKFTQSFSKYISKSSFSTTQVADILIDNAVTHEEDNDYIINDLNIINIILSDNYISIDDESVATINGNSIIITSAGVYNISGTLSDGQVIVNTLDEEVVKIILNNVDITSTTDAPFYIASANKTILMLADDSKNYLSDSENNSEKGVLLSKDDLTIYGNGALSVTSNLNDGIRSNDGLIIKSGNITVDSVDDGIRGKNYLIIKDGDININSNGSGLKSDNDEKIDKGYILIENGDLNINSSEGNCITAQTDVLVTGGDFNLICDKGLKAETIIIDSGNFTINSNDDSLNATNNIVINSGTYNITAKDDGIHADTSIEINGGEFDILNSYEGLESQLITINNGYIKIKASDDGINLSGENNSSNDFMPNNGDFNMNEPRPEGDFNMNEPRPEGDFNMSEPRPDGDFNMTRPNGGGMQGSGDYYLYINGGYIIVDSDGDGLDSNGYIKMNDGVVIVNGAKASSPDSAIDFDISFNITGGSVIASGSSKMTLAPDDNSTQNSLFVKFDSIQNADKLITIESDLGENIITFTPIKTYQSFIFSSPLLLTGDSYTLYLDNNKYSDFTISSIITEIK